MTPDDCQDPSSCGCGPSVSRRSFLELAGLAAAVPMLAGRRAVAGPFTQADFAKLIPADKKLDPTWVRSLRDRGEAEVYQGAELHTIGMPIGGIGSGQVYLGGDGSLWHWDILNLPQPGNFTSSAGPNYAKPPEPASPFEVGFAIEVKGDAVEKPRRRLDRQGFDPAHIRFRGEYPIGRVTYDDPTYPVKVELEAFSPFVPLDVEASSLPVTVMRFTVTNRTQAPQTVSLAGWLENPVCLGSAEQGVLGQRRNRVEVGESLTLLHATAEPLPDAKPEIKRADMVYETFEDGYGKWTIEGEAFGKEPARGTLPGQQQVAGFQGQRLVNSFFDGDRTTGTLTSPTFRIERRFIAFLIGGGAFRNRTCLNLLIDGKVVRSAQGRDNERLDWASWNVAEFEGKEAQLRIVDAESGGWGHVNVDQIVFTDAPQGVNLKLEAQEDYGSMTLAVLEGKGESPTFGHPSLDEPLAVFETNRDPVDAVAPFGPKLLGGVGRTVSLAPGASEEVTFLVAWHFPGLPRTSLGPLVDLEKLKRSYAKRFDSAAAVARHVAANLEDLTNRTRLWNRTWYDSTLPYWFLDRTFIPICTLATSTCYIFDSGRFYAFEGVRCCQGTCQHVWNYAQSVARIFPSLERDLRVRTDFGTAWHENGATDYRGEAARHVAHDGQCGVILRAYREHLTAADDEYLKATWPRIRQSIEYLIGCDGDANGIIEGEQYNTLDAAWFGPMAWISSFYIAALRAGEAMATDVGDAAFAARCRGIAEKGSAHLLSDLYNGEYFIHKPDPAHPDSTNTNNGCHIDQLMGQAWAFQVGLPRIVPPKEATSALDAIWLHNFTPDAGAYMKAMQEVVKGGRWYAMPGEGGVVMTTFPRGGADTASGKGGFAFYFNEVWTGQEHQLAAHMLWERQIDPALVITKMVHDRHHASLRSPYNEVECSDHYARAMSSHGSFLAACGFEYNGPKGHIAFAPRLTPENFKAPFTAAEGWGTYEQRFHDGTLTATITPKWGRLRLQSIALERPGEGKVTSVRVAQGNRAVPAKFRQDGLRVAITLEGSIVLEAEQALTIDLA